MKVIYKKRVDDIGCQIADAIREAEQENRQILSIFLERDEWDAFVALVRGLGGIGTFYKGCYKYQFMGVTVRPKPAVKAQLKKEFSEEVMGSDWPYIGRPGYDWQVWRIKDPEPLKVGSITPKIWGFAIPPGVEPDFEI